MFGRKSKPEGPIDFLIAGLGNPGKQYEGTRHNAGFMVMEALGEKLGAEITRVKFKSYCTTVSIGDVRVLLLMPQTFMNLSGQAVTEAMRFYKLPAEKVIVVFDDISLEPGKLRIRRKGSDAGITGSKTSYICRERTPFPGLKWEWAKSPGPTIIWRTGCCHGSPSRNSRPWMKQQSGPPRPRS